MSTIPCPVGRTQVLALAHMNLRVKFTPRPVGLRHCTRCPVTHAGRWIGARYQPRDERGRFVPYAWVKPTVRSVR